MIRSPASPGLWRKVWAGGPAGSEVVMQVVRENETLTVRILSADRTRFLKDTEAALIARRRDASNGPAQPAPAARLAAPITKSRPLGSCPNI